MHVDPRFPPSRLSVSDRGDESWDGARAAPMRSVPNCPMEVSQTYRSSILKISVRSFILKIATDHLFWKSRLIIYFEILTAETRAARLNKPVMSR